MPNSFHFPESLYKQILFPPAHPPPPLLVSICSAWPSLSPFTPSLQPLCVPLTCLLASSFHAVSVPGFLLLSPIWHAFTLSSSHLIALHKINFNETQNSGLHYIEKNAFKLIHINLENPLASVS